MRLKICKVSTIGLHLTTRVSKESPQSRIIEKAIEGRLAVMQQSVIASAITVEIYANFVQAKIRHLNYSNMI